MTWTTKYSLLVMLAMLPASFVSSCSTSVDGERLNRSDLYDPSSVTLIEGREYQFQEGKITGRGQIFHSHYSYLRALTIGAK